MAESDTEDRKYPYRFHPCNEILKRLHEIFETSKKQDLTPPRDPTTKMLEYFLDIYIRSVLRYERGFKGSYIKRSFPSLNSISQEKGGI